MQFVDSSVAVNVEEATSAMLCVELVGMAERTVSFLISTSQSPINTAEEGIYLLNLLPPQCFNWKGKGY